LTEVAVDGVTITGNGTTADPLVAVGGGGLIVLQTDDVNNGSQSILNLKEGTNITLTDDGVGGVTIDASGGGTPQVNSDWNAASGVAEILNKPTIPAAQIQSDWTQANNAAVDFIKNKPTIPSISGLVPYTGATTNVDLGTHTLSAKDLVINHPSGSGVAASITKGGSGEALTVVKSSGSGNAASITGGVTLIDELHLTTDLADAYIASAATWNAKQDALTTTKSVEINSGNVELDGDETSPTARKFYSTNGSSVRGWRAIEKLDLPAIIQGAAYPYVEREYIGFSGANAIVKVPSSNIIFVANTTTQTVVCYDTQTSQALSTTSVSNASGLVYVAATGEVWAFGPAASITRFTATTGVSLGATTVLLLTASCRGVYDDSTVTGNVYAYNGGTMNVINHSTYARTAVSIGAGSGSNELTLVTSGVQAGLLVGTVNVGVFGFNKSTNTLAYGPISGAANTARSIKYIPSINRIVAVAGSRILFYETTTSTTLTLMNSLQNTLNANYIDFDETENFLFITSGFGSSSFLKLSIFDLTTLLSIKTMLLTLITDNAVGYIAPDKSNKTLYITGTTTNGIINKVIYA
jgi:hypothetical protein